jgi:hypothetical protein
MDKDVYGINKDVYGIKKDVYGIKPGRLRDGKDVYGME